jgi:hypothetical protein
VECGTSGIWDVKDGARKPIKKEVRWSSWDSWKEGYLLYTVVSNYVVTTVGDHLCSADGVFNRTWPDCWSGRPPRRFERGRPRLGGLPCAGDLADCDLLRGEAVGDF